MIDLAAGLLMPAFSVVASPGSEDWKAGIASVMITPEEPVQMAGYASRTKPFKKVNDDLYAKNPALSIRV